MIAKALELRDEATFIPILCVDMNPNPDSEPPPVPFELEPDWSRPGVSNISVAAANERFGLQARYDAVREWHRTYDAQRYLLRRCGYACDGRPNIIMTRLDGSGKATNDPYAWGGQRTYMVAHDYIINHWAELKDGDVVDVQWILGETKEPKRSERETA